MDTKDFNSHIESFTDSDVNKEKLKDYYGEFAFGVFDKDTIILQINLDDRINGVEKKLLIDWFSNVTPMVNFIGKRKTAYSNGIYEFYDNVTTYVTNEFRFCKENDLQVVQSKLIIEKENLDRFKLFYVPGDGLCLFHSIIATMMYKELKKGKSFTTNNNAIKLLIALLKYNSTGKDGQIPIDIEMDTNVTNMTDFFKNNIWIKSDNFGIKCLYPLFDYILAENIVFSDLFYNMDAIDQYGPSLLIDILKIQTLHRYQLHCLLDDIRNQYMKIKNTEACDASYLVAKKNLGFSDYNKFNLLEYDDYGIEEYSDIEVVTKDAKHYSALLE